MNDGRRTLAIALVSIGLVGLVTVYVISLSSGTFADIGGYWTLMTWAFLLSGGLIAIPRPRHPIGWIFLTVGVAGTVAAMLGSIAASSHATGETAAWLFTASSALSTTFTVPAFLALVLFPDGSPPSSRWRWLVWLNPPVAVLGGVAATLVGGWGGDAEQGAMASPLAGRWGELGATLSEVFFPLMGVLIVAGGISLIMRFRRSRGDERKQLQWVAFAAAVLLLLTLGLENLVSSGSAAASDSLDAFLTAIAIAFIPVAAAVAVLRYRLYDIDIVINRAVVVATLGAFITAVYVGIVAGVGSLIGTRGERDLVLSIIATAVVAVAFQPVRRRVQHLANRLVYGERATPYEVLSRFSRRSTEGSGDVLAHVAELMAEGTGAERAVVYGRVGDELRPEAVWPIDRQGDLPVLDVTDAFGGVFDLAVPVEHEGDLLGLVAITEPRGQAPLDVDRELIDRIAGGLGILLRNRRLTADLERRIDELQRSRRRLVAAQDDTRRKLERDMHDGPQQQLVGLKVQVGLLRRRAEELGATNTVGLLQQLADDADAAIDAVRDVARGIYPPLLAEEGIAGAVTAQARKLPVPVTVQAPGPGRYAPDLEAAVYFCILEALTNAVKYADAGSVVVALAERDGALHVSVTDDGAGFDAAHVSGTGLANMADRVDALDGTVTITSDPAHGTTIELQVPAAPVVPQVT